MSPSHTSAPTELGILESCAKCGRLNWRNGTCAHGTVPPPSPDAPKEVVKDRRGRVVCVHGVKVERYCRRCAEDEVERRHEEGGEG